MESHGRAGGDKEQRIVLRGTAFCVRASIGILLRFHCFYSHAKCAPANACHVEGIIGRVPRRLEHDNSAVVIHFELHDGARGSNTTRNLTRKIAPPLVILLNSEPEIQYVSPNKGHLNERAMAKLPLENRYPAKIIR